MSNAAIPQQLKRCFTTKCHGIANRLINQVGISSSLSDSGQFIDNAGPTIMYNALWDTGATCSCISTKVANDLKLPIISNRKIQSATGSDVKNVHIVDIFLPSYICMARREVVCADIQDFDILIGMDIIQIGDFIVSNFNGQTFFTFRFPSMHNYDFIKCDYLAFQKSKTTVGRNQQCPCGSGKKYKHCHGKEMLEITL